MTFTTEQYWQCIPIGKENAISYASLQCFWGVKEREVRRVLEKLSKYDNGDPYILIRSSRGGGFYRTDDPDDIEAYRKERYSIAMKNLAHISKINRIKRDSAALNVSKGDNESNG